MKIIAVGDIHGRAIWKDIAKEEFDCDRFIFIGDYFDTRENISAEDQIQNFLDILNFKKSNPTKVVLLLGNHDFHYLKGIDENYSGYQPLKAMDIQEALYKAVDNELIQICHTEYDIIFSHAGVSNTWCWNTFGPKFEGITDIKTVECIINELFVYRPRIFGFTPGINGDNYGNDKTQTPIWIRPASLIADGLYDFRQVVGHTTMDSIILKDGITFIDTLGVSGEYLEIIDGVMDSKSLPV